MRLEKTFHLAAGQSFLIIPGVLIRYYPDREDPWKYIWVNFSGTEARQLMENCSLSEKNPIAEQHLTGWNSYFSRQCVNSVLQPPLSSAAAAAISGFCFMVSETYPAVESSRQDNFIRLLEFIENNLQQPELNINLLAARLSFEPVFPYTDGLKRELGTGPNQYILELRLQKARGLLAREDLSVKSIAFSSGFFRPAVFFAGVQAAYRGQSYRIPQHAAKEKSVIT